MKCTQYLLFVESHYIYITFVVSVKKAFKDRGIPQNTANGKYKVWYDLLALSDSKKVDVQLFFRKMGVNFFKLQNIIKSYCETSSG